MISNPTLYAFPQQSILRLLSIVIPRFSTTEHRLGSHHFTDTALTKVSRHVHIHWPLSVSSVISQQHTQKITALSFPLLASRALHSLAFHSTSHTVFSHSSLLIPLTPSPVNDGIPQGSILSSLPSIKYFLMLGVSIHSRDFKCQLYLTPTFLLTRFCIQLNILKYISE